MSFKKFLRELRRNPEQNPKIPIFQQLEKYLDDPDIYISFTKIDKIGINPHSPYNTPLGIYAYPLKEIAEDNNWKSLKTVKVPYAGKSPYVWIFRPRNPEKILDINNYDSSDWDKDIEVLNEKFGKSVVDSWIDDSKMTAKVNTIGGIFWKLMLNLLRVKFPGARSDNRMKRITYWNKLFREMGYDGVSDKGKEGIIHTAEPIQAIFFSKNAIKVIDKVENKDYGIKPLQSMHYYFEIGKFIPANKPNYIRKIPIVLKWNSKTPDADYKIMDNLNIKMTHTLNSPSTIPTNIMLDNYKQVMNAYKKISENPQSEVANLNISFSDNITTVIETILLYGTDDEFFDFMYALLKLENEGVKYPDSFSGKSIKEYLEYLSRQNWVQGYITPAKEEFIHNLS